MTREEAIAFVQAQAVSANIHCMGMAVANAVAVGKGEKRPYTADDFFQLERDYCISHNAVLSVFQEST